MLFLFHQPRRLARRAAHAQRRNLHRKCGFSDGLTEDIRCRSSKAAFVDVTTRELFPESNEISARALTRLTVLDERLRLLLAKIKAVKFGPPEQAVQNLQPPLEAEKSSLVSMIEQEFQRKLRRLINQLELHLSGAFLETRTKFQAAVQTARRKRIIRYVLFIVVSGLIGAAAYESYRNLTQEVPHSLFWTLLMHLIADLLGGLIGFSIAKWRDNFPKAVSKIREEFEILFRKQMDEITNDELNQYEPSIVAGFNLKLTSLYQRVLMIDPDGWHERSAEHLELLRTLHSEFETTRVECHQVIDELISKVSAYFSDAAKNLAVLNRAAERIKEKAIEPSFGLLARTSQSLSDVKHRLHAIEFS